MTKETIENENCVIYNTTNSVALCGAREKTNSKTKVHLLNRSSKMLQKLRKKKDINGSDLKKLVEVLANEDL